MHMTTHKSYVVQTEARVFKELQWIDLCEFGSDVNAVRFHGERSTQQPNENFRIVERTVTTSERVL